MQYKTRLYIFFGTISVFCFGLVPLRLFELQVIHQDYYDELVEERRVRQDQVDAPRGRILARDGTVLTTDAATFDLKIHLRLIKDEAELIAKLSRITAIPEFKIAYELESLRQSAIADRVGEALQEVASGQRPLGWNYKIAEHVPLESSARAGIEEDLPAGVTLFKEQRRRWFFFKKEAGEYSVWVDFLKFEGPADDPYQLVKSNNGKVPVLLGSLLHLDSEALAEKLDESRAVLHEKILRRTEPMVLIPNLSYETMIRVASSASEVLAASIGTRSVRRYLQKQLLGQVLGTTGKPNEAQLKEWLKDSEDIWIRRWARSGIRPSSSAFFFVTLNRELAKIGLTQDDMVGRSGIESVFEENLRGRRGRRWVERDSRNRIQEVLDNDESHAGHNVVLTIEPRLQKILEEEFDSEAGAAIFMDVRTGEILATGSFPNFDPNDLVPPVSQETVDRLYRSKSQPTINRAFGSQYPLGSIFKILSSISMLEEGIIQPDSHINCQGALFPNNRTRFRCWAKWGHQEINVQQALQQSCNVFYYICADRAGPDPILKWAKEFEFGERPGTEVRAYESSGLLPDADWKDRRLNEPWYKGDTRNLSIGQGYLTVSPLQVVRMMAAVANGGMLTRPRLVKEIIDEDFRQVKFRDTDTSDVQRIAISASTLEVVRQGLFDVVNTRQGTASKAFKDSPLPFHLAGKTSTAQSGRADGNVGWFAGYYPAEQPRIAFAVVCEGLLRAENDGDAEEHGGDVVAPIVRRILERYEIPAQPSKVVMNEDSGARIQKTEVIPPR
ncbi:MAG: penicillin-binding transpeptidase domain-containing protein [Planctomycetota bacterium]|nr:penicillin-binding transpeptidase domain-containing protein [Planctomycetota bacterium]